MSENLTGARDAVHPAGHKNAGDHCTNSGTGIITCCYINALGKVLLKGQLGDGRRFRAFVTTCMQDFLQADSTKALPPTPRNQVGGEHWLYEVYRCGFVHAFYPTAGAWGRADAGKKYWSFKNGRPILNIDAFVKAFMQGVEEFKNQASADPDLRANFEDYITRD
jgi:hypothetical protein